MNVDAIPEVVATPQFHISCSACGRQFKVHAHAENYAFYCPNCCAGHEHLWVIA